MADRKISDLTALTTPATGDLIPIVDISEAAAADKNKSITVGELLRGAPDGTAAAPGFAFESDGGNGMFLGGTDILAFSTGGSQAVTIDASQRLGVGTSLPDATLHISKSLTDGDTLLRIQPTSFSAGYSVRQAFTRGSTDLVRFTVTSDAGNADKGSLLISTSSTTNTTNPVAAFTGDGRVGIGTTAPSSLTHINQATADAGVLRLTSQWSSVAPLLVFERAAGAVAGALRYNDSLSGMQLGTTTSHNFYVMTGGNNAITVDSSQRVGIGTTSPSYKCDIDVTGSALRLNSTTSQALLVISSDDAANAKIEFGDESDNDRGAITYDNPNNALIFQANAAERFRCDSSGRLLVGTSTASNQNNAGGASAREAKAYIFNNNSTTTERYSLAINSGSANNSGPSLNLSKTRATTDTHTVVQSDDTLGEIRFQGSDGTYFVQGARISALVDGTPGSQDMPGRLVFSTTADGASSPTERMRLDRGGSLKVTADAGIDCLYSTTPTAAGTSVTIFRGGHSATAGDPGTGTDSFYVFANGNVQNTNNSYGAISDSKLKENIVDASSQWDDLKAIQVRNYNFKEGQTHTQIGVVAQEVELVSPGLVTEAPDRDEEGNDLGTTTKSVNYSVLYMKAVKALQEAIGRIETLEAEVAALKGA